MTPTTEQYLRFNHSQFAQGAPFAGMTIAYTRDESKILFSYTLCSKKDRFEKRLGRESASKMFYENIDQLTVDETGVDHNLRCGVILLDDFKAFVSDHTSGILADHVTDSLTLMDFKHAFIGNTLRLLLLETFLADAIEALGG